MKENPDGGLSGKLDDAASLLQFIAVREVAGVLNATNAEAQTASFVFRQNGLARGRAGKAKGEDAVHNFVAHFNSGTFDFVPNISALDHDEACTISRPLRTILLSAYDHLKCSFCGKSGAEVEKLIEGPKVLICNECIRSFSPKAKSSAENN